MKDVSFFALGTKTYELQSINTKETKVKIRKRCNELTNQLEGIPSFFSPIKKSSRFDYFVCCENLTDTHVLIELCEKFRGNKMLDFILKELKKGRV